MLGLVITITQNCIKNQNLTLEGSSRKESALSISLCDLTLNHIHTFQSFLGGERIDFYQCWSCL